MHSRKRKWSKENLIESVRNSSSYRQVLKKINLIPAGGNYTQLKRYILEYDLPTKHFKGKGWSKGMKNIGKPITPLKDILIRNSDFQSFKLKKRLFEANIKERKCEICSWSKKSIDGRIPLELDHINGDRYDNRLSNIRILCPNCHSLQPTHRGLNQKRRKA